MNQKKMKAAAVSATLAFALLATPAWAAPSEILAHGSVSVFDYYLDNYDENGNVRITRKKLRLICQDNRQKPMRLYRRFTLPMRNSQRTAVGLTQGQKYSLNLH